MIDIHFLVKTTGLSRYWWALCGKIIDSNVLAFARKPSRACDHFSADRSKVTCERCLNLKPAK